MDITAAIVDDIASSVATQMGVSLSTLDESRLKQAIEDTLSLIADQADITQIDQARGARVVRWVVVEWAEMPASGVVQREVAVDDSRTSVRYDSRRQALTDLLAKHWASLWPTKVRRHGTFSVSPSYAPDVRCDWR